VAISRIRSDWKRMAARIVLSVSLATLPDRGAAHGR
jgi:hypothetical protein